MPVRRACALLIAAMLSPATLAQAPKERFDVWEYEVAGASLLPETEIEAAVYPYLGEGRSFADVEAARSALDKAFRDAGYQTVLVSIPEQPVASGVIRLEVTEAPLDRVRVLGARYYSPEQVLAEAPSLVEGAVPHFPGLQEDMARLNRMPGRRVTPVLKPGKRPGSTEIDLNVEDEAPWGGSVGLSNDHSPSTEPLRATLSLHYDNLFQRQHRLGLQYLTSPQDTSQVRAISASYLVPLGRPGEFISAYAARSKSGVAVLDTTNALGDGDVVGLRWIVPLPGSGAVSHSLTLGVDYKNFKEQLVQADSEPIKTPIRYWPFSVSWGGSLREPAGEVSFSLGVVFGLRGLGSTEESFAEKRFLARGNFFALKGELESVMPLGSGIDLATHVEGQIANQPLVSNEQFFAGGADSVRGYLQAEALGDSGYRTSIELRAPSLAGAWLPQLGQLRPHVFVEGASLTRKDPLPSETRRVTLASAGVGLRLRAYDSLALALDVGWPLRRTGTAADPTTESGKPRLHFSTVLDF